MTERASYIYGLRRIADVLEKNPAMKLPYFGVGCLRVETIEEMRQVALAVGGHWEKEQDADSFALRQRFTPYDLQLFIYAHRETVCERIVIGTREVPEKTIPAVPAQDERIVPAHVEEIVKWVCPEILV